MATPMIFPPPNSWPIGFGFRPTEEELITHYLKNKMLGHESLVQYIIREVDLYNFEPWQLPKQSIFESDNHEWFFFRALPSNGRLPKTKRTTRTGYWKSTGEDRKIKARGTNKVIGTRKILVFHKGKSPNVVKTKWIIHEYHLHLDTNIPYQRSFVICRLKENAEENDVSTCDEDEQNNRVASHSKKKVTDRAHQEVYTESQANERSVFEPGHQSWYSEPQSALIGHDGEVNRQPIQPGATESEANLTEWLNSIIGDECFDDVTSNMRMNSDIYKDEYVNSYNETGHQSSRYSEPEPVSMDFQPADGYDGEVNRQLLQPGASENEFDPTEFWNSVEFEDQEFDDLTSKSCFNSYSKEELESMVYELQCRGTYDDGAFSCLNNHISPSGFHGHINSGVQTQDTLVIKESRRRPLTVKRSQYKEEKDIYRLYELQGNFSVLSDDGEARMCGGTMDNDDSNHGPRTIKAQWQPKSNNLVTCGSVPRRIRLKEEIRNKALAQDKAKEDGKHIKLVGSPQLSITDSRNGQKSEVGSNSSQYSMSCCGSIDRKGNGFSYILTTKRIHHKSSLPLAYAAKAFLGIIMFVMFVQEVLLYGSWY